jgi:hypothetical protein
VYQNFNKFQPTDSELWIHQPHNSFSLCGFDHRDAWNLQQTSYDQNVQLILKSYLPVVSAKY